MSISKKQLNANKSNSLKWWVKTPEWKDISKYNAIKHWLSSSVYDKKLEEKIIEEYWVEWSLEKLLIKNICISKARYEKWIELEQNLINHIIKPSKIIKKYNSKKEYDKYQLELEEIRQENSIMLHLWVCEPDHNFEQRKWYDFDYDMKKLDYLVNVIWKYNHQNQLSYQKGIISLLQLIK